MPAEVSKENVKYFAEFIFSQFYGSMISSKFPLPFKLANITPVSKKTRNHKHKYRTVSILQIISKMFLKKS